MARALKHLLLGALLLALGAPAWANAPALDVQQSQVFRAWFVRIAQEQGLGHVSPTSGRSPTSVASWCMAQIASAAPWRLWNRSR